MVGRTKVNGTRDRADMEIGIRKRTLRHTGRAELMGNEIEAAMNLAIPADRTIAITIERPTRLGTIGPMAIATVMAMPDSATITMGIPINAIRTGKMDVTTTSRIRRTGMDFAME
jgi:hypothetical protein